MKLAAIHSTMKGLGILLLLITIVPSVARAQTVSSLVIDRIVAQPFANPDSAVDVTTRVRNTGSDTITGVLVTEDWPADFQVTGAVNQKSQWLVARLQPGQAQSQTFRVNIAADAELGMHALVTHVRVAEPALEKNLEYAFDIRQVQVLGEAIPTTSGSLSHVEIVGGVIMIHLFIIALLLFALADGAWRQKYSYYYDEEVIH